MIPDTLREQLRQRSHNFCEYCQRDGIRIPDGLNQKSRAARQGEQTAIPIEVGWYTFVIPELHGQATVPAAISQLQRLRAELAESLKQ